MEAVLEKTDFYFDEATHTYYLDGKRLYGVTNILNSWGKGGLIQWAVNMAVDHIKKNPNDFDGAKKAHITVRDDAASKGTDVHAMVEAYVRSLIKENEGLAHHSVLEAFEKDPIKNPQVQKFLEWAVGEQITFLDAEQRVYSREHWYAGTFDILLEKDGKRFIADVKTGKAVYPNYFYQMAAYRLALEEMTSGLDMELSEARERGYSFTAMQLEDLLEPIQGAMVIRLGKDGSFEVKERYDYTTDKNAFLGILAAFKADQTYLTSH